MTIDREHNKGATFYMLGHAVICPKAPPKLMEIGKLHIISVVTKYSKEHGYVLELDTHIKMLALLNLWEAACVENEDINVILAMYLNLIKTEVNHMQEVSSKFLPPKNGLLDITKGGYTLTMNGHEFDLRHFFDRIYLMQHKEKLPPGYIKTIQDLQQQCMPIASDPSKILHTWEIRERLIGNPCGLLWDNKKFNSNVIPPLDKYVQSEYRLNIIDRYSQTMKQVDIVIYFNKAALESNIAGLNEENSTIQQYEAFPYICKSSTLLGKNFVFLHLKCAKDKCDDHKKPCSKSLFYVSDILNLFINKLHIFIKKTLPKKELSDAFLQLLLEKDLGNTKSSILDKDTAYYDFNMDEDSTVIIAGCSGHDSAVGEIFYAGSEVL